MRKILAACGFLLFDTGAPAANAYIVNVHWK
jgi:hypothetical protein